MQATVGEKAPSTTPVPAPSSVVPPKTSKNADQNTHESVESSNNKSGGSKLYSMGTASIMSIVGVVVGIAVILLLFVAISRKNYDGDSDDEDDPRRLGCQIDGGAPIARLSPTFLMNGVPPTASGQVFVSPTPPDGPHLLVRSGVGSLKPGASAFFGASHMSHQSAVSSVAFAGASGLGAQPVSPLDLREPSTDSAEHWSGDSEFLDSRDSDGWSSVLESEYDHGGVSRCTRDTNLSSIMLSQNFSEYYRSTGARRTTALGYGSDTSAAYRKKSQRGTRHERSVDNGETESEQVDTFSIASFDVDQVKRANGTAIPAARSTAASSFYRDDSMASSVVDSRPTDASAVAARYAAR
ncbi:hypothetical protein ATCC90586_003584 [Pythium insidiosum]|nr:hypothetical protein ATCC90586_003584 [Pythium insidiosum]